MSDKETRMMNSTQQSEVNGGTPLADPTGSAFDSEEPDDREERCDSCGETSHCLMNGLCPMCYELNGGTHD